MVAAAFTSKPFGNWSCCGKWWITNIKVNKILARTLKRKGVNMFLFLLLNNFMQNGLMWLMLFFWSKVKRILWGRVNLDSLMLTWACLFSFVLFLFSCVGEEMLYLRKSSRACVNSSLNLYGQNSLMVPLADSLGDCKQWMKLLRSDRERGFWLLRGTSRLAGNNERGSIAFVFAFRARVPRNPLIALSGLNQIRSG